MSKPVEFEQGSDTWHKLRKRAQTDLYWLAAKVLQLEDKIPMRPRVHLGMCRFAERRTGIPEIDSARIQMIACTRGSGKALALDTPIPTPTGWTTMGEVRVGDVVFDDKGQPTEVLAVSPVFIGHKCYRVEFNDGSSVVADAEHLWVTEDVVYRSSKRLGGFARKCLATTEELAASRTKGSRNDLNHAISLAKALELPEVSLPIDPYVLGIWLGDGTSANGDITTMDAEVLESIKHAGYELVERHSASKGKAKTYGVVGLTQRLRQLGLLNNKHIPVSYFRASTDQRLSLLQGLLDSDGWAGTKATTAHFSNTNKLLADGLYELAVSLGMKAWRRERRAKLYGKDCGPAYEVTFRPLMQVFRLARKAQKLDFTRKQASRHTHRMITKIVPVESVPTKCIRVASASSMFLCGDAMIPTHNSACVTTARTVQRLLQNRNWSAGVANESAEKAKKFLAAIKAQFESNEFLQFLFPELIPDFRKTIWAADQITINRSHPDPINPSVAAVGVASQTAGFHMNEWIVDDLISDAAAENARKGLFTEIDAANRWVTRLPPLLKRPQQDPITFIYTPWFLEDTYHFIEETFSYGETEKRFMWVLELPDGTSQHIELTRRGSVAKFSLPIIDEQGQSIFPELVTTEELEQIRMQDPLFYSCTPPDTEVLTDAGLRQISTLQAGDMVVSGTGQLRKVAYVHAEPFEGELVGIKVKGVNRPILLTPNHRLPTLAGDKRADELTTADRLIQPISTEMGQLAFDDPELWWLVGHWLADGCATHSVQTVKGVGYSNYRACHCFAIKERDLAERVSNIVQRKLHRKARIYKTDIDNSFGKSAVWNVAYGHKDFVAFLCSMKLDKPGQKVLPYWMETAPPELLRELLEGYLAGDGYVLGKHRAVNSVCRPLLEQMQRICGRLGLVANLSTTGPNKRGHQELFHLKIRNDDAGLDKATTTKLHERGITRKVSKLYRVPYSGPVYNLEVEQDHSFCIANVAVLNSQYLLKPTGGTLSDFKSEWLQEFAWEGPKQIRFKKDGRWQYRRVQDLTTIMSVDPAISKKETSARSAVIVTGTDGENVFLLEAWCGRVGATDLAQRVINFTKTYSPHRIIIETVAYQGALKDVLELLAGQQQLPMSMFPLADFRPGPQDKKDVRIFGLEPWFRKGLFYFCPKTSQDFYQEYVNFPNTKLRDVLDALSMQRDQWEALNSAGRSGQGTRLHHIKASEKGRIDKIRNHYSRGRRQ